MSKALAPHPDTNFSDLLGRDMPSLIPTIGLEGMPGLQQEPTPFFLPQTSQQQPIPVRQSHLHSVLALTMVATAAASINTSILSGSPQLTPLFNRQA